MAGEWAVSPPGEQLHTCAYKQHIDFKKKLLRVQRVSFEKFLAEGQDRGTRIRARARKRKDSFPSSHFLGPWWGRVEDYTASARVRRALRQEASRRLRRNRSSKASATPGALPKATLRSPFERRERCLSVARVEIYLGCAARAEIHTGY